ncbi:hypothetical protein L195_g063811, partial [Trifolium pratense]
MICFFLDENDRDRGGWNSDVDHEKYHVQ